MSCPYTYQNSILRTDINVGTFLFLYTGRTLPTYEVYHFQGHFMSQELENSYGHAYGYELRDISLP